MEYSINTNNPSITTQSNNFLKPGVSHHVRQKTPVKIYNANLNQFEYEVNTKQKRNQLSELNPVHTPSNMSIQSVVIHNDILPIPCVRELIALSDCTDDSYITLQQMFYLLKKLRIATPYVPIKHFEYLRFQTDRLKIEDLFMFLTTDMTTLEFQELSKEELILKFGMEVFRAVGKESTELKIMDVIQYIKEHKTLGFDLSQTFELFDFYKSEINGSLKNKLSLNAFFHKSAPILYQVFTSEYIQKIRQIFTAIKQDPLRSQQPSSPAMIKSYDPEKTHVGRRSLVSRFNENSTPLRRETETQNTAPPTNRALNSDLRDPEIEDVFFEVHPKNRGWLMRRSRKHNNKWAMVFCDISEGRFLSAQPTSLKKTIEIKHLEIHKCNFLEIMNRFDLGGAPDVKKGHRRVGSYSHKMVDHEAQKQNIKLEFCFFILDKKNQKTYLIRSPDNLIIGSIIHFYLHKDKYTHLYDDILSPLYVVEPEFSGVIEIAICKKKSIGRYHSSLKSYTFKKQFLIMKKGKFNVYDMKLKDNINLAEFEIKQKTDLDILPQTNPFVFMLEKLDSKRLRELNLQAMKDGLISEADEEGIHDQKKPRGKDTGFLDSETGGPEEKKSTMNYIHNLFKGLVGSGTKKKKEERVTLACDTETKRRQWALTLNYFISLNTKAAGRPKGPGGTKESLQNTYEEMSFKPSPEGGIELTGGEKRKKKNKPSLQFKNTPQENSDFYDVYNKESEFNLGQPGTKPLQTGMIDLQKDYKPDRLQNTETLISKSKKPLITQLDKNHMPLITEPDLNNPLDSEEILMTFTQFNAENLPIFLKNNPNANQQLNLDDPMYLFTKEIKTLSDVELWQKFLIFFLKEKHPCAHFDLQEEIGVGENRKSVKSVRNSIEASKFECELVEDEPLVRRVMIDNYNNNFTK